MGRLFVAVIAGAATVGAAACVLDRSGFGSVGETSGFGGKTASSSTSSASGSSTRATASSGMTSCVDGLLNGDESDVDCGGTECPACGYGRTCGSTKDCALGTCSSGLCVPEPVLAWRKLAPSAPPPARVGFAISEDALGKVMLFGGSNPAELTPSIDQWSFDGSAWSAYAGPLPEKRAAAAVAYDSIRKKVVLFGGGDPNVAFLNDTWEWDGASWLQIPVTGPAVRYHSAMAFDPIRKVIVLFGGSNGGLFNDTWEYDGTAWKQAAPVTIPKARQAHQMAYDAKSHRVLMVGGYDGGSGVDDDTWLWDGIDWKDVTPAGPSNLPARFAAAALADPETGEVIVHGGVSATKTALGDTWTWDGGSWSELATTPEDPGLVVSDTMAFVGPAHHAILFSTWDGTALKQETWELFSVGGACSDPSECGSSACLDHLCCQRACSSCESCATDATPGFCAPIDADAGCDAGN